MTLKVMLDKWQCRMLSAQPQSISVRWSVVNETITHTLHYIGLQMFKVA